MFVSQTCRSLLILMSSGSTIFWMGFNQNKKKSVKVPPGYFKWVFEQLFRTA